ncbi:5'/3'-nucleotidase SurE [Thermus tengchongensis]|uniref:5'/3'-nucleotidase SurE n=1 Tax=Thermus tengchongensis TaxID=1214928 RepID=UPI001F4455FF|nr:5'/3'-nucleotidase SurE [Thermus tengchongensis]
MHILVNDDDGLFSPGLWALAEAASRFGEVFVAAPDVEQSGVGHAITIAHPVRALPHPYPLPGPHFPAYRVRGTPADCVALGLRFFGPVDQVLSGINLGSNLGHEIWHSGTVAAARQGTPHRPPPKPGPGHSPAGPQAAGEGVVVAAAVLRERGGGEARGGGGVEEAAGAPGEGSGAKPMQGYLAWIKPRAKPTHWGEQQKTRECPGFFPPHPGGRRRT